MVDVARLQIEADSRQVKDASRDLQGLTGAAGKAAKAAGILAGAYAALKVLEPIIRLTSQYESALIGVSKTTGLVGRDLDLFSDRIDAVSRKLPISTAELLELSQAAGQMGVSGARNIEKFAVTIAKLGRASDLSGEFAAKSLARILNVTGEAVSEIDTLASVIVSLGNNSAASESEIARMTTEVARATGVFKVSSAEAAAMAAAMSSIGIRAELGGSAVGRAMQAITNAISEGGSELENFAGTLNLNAKTLTELFAQNKTKAFEFFLQAVGDLGLDAGAALEEVGLGGQEIAKTIIPLANNMDIFTRSMELANDEVENATALDREFEATLKTLSAQWQVTKNIVADYARTIGEVLIPVVNSALKLFNRFGDAVQEDAVTRQVQLIDSLQERLETLKTRQKFLGPLAFLGVDKKEMDLLEQQIEDGISDLARMAPAFKGVEKAAKEAAGGVETFNNEGDKTGEITGDLNRQLIKQQQEAERTADEINRLTREYDPLFKRNEDLARLLELRAQGLPESIFNSAAARAINEYIDATKQVEESIEGVDDAQDDLTRNTRQVTYEVSQLWKQAGRNIQSTLADSIFNFFRDGLDGMVANVGRAIGRIASEFAALRLAQGMGLAGMFGMPGMASAGGGMGFANLAAGAGNLVNSGFGLSSLFGSFATSGAGQGLGLSVTGPVANFGQLTPLGSGLSTGIGAFGAGAAGVGIGSLLAGNNEIGGLGGTATSTIGAGVGAAAGSIVPGVGTAIGALAGGVIGGAINALFGRGPLEFQEQTLTGDVTAGGFDGALVDRFKAKGGLFRGSKTDNIIASTSTGQIINQFGEFSESGISGGLQPIAEERAQQAVEIGKLLNETFSSLTDSMRGTAEVLDISTDGLDAFRAELHLVSESGEALTSQAISEEISRISDEMARSLIPNIEELSRHGETSSQTVSRLNAEFLSLQNALELLGVSSEQTRLFLTGLSAEQRTAFTDAAGGADALTQKITFFAENFLSAEEKLDISMNRLNVEMAKLGLTADISVDQFKELVQSVTQAGGVSVEFANSLLDLAPAFITVKNQMEALEQTTIDVDSTNDLAEAQQRVFDARAQLISSYQDERSELESVKAQFVGIADTLRDASDKLSLSSLSPLTPGQRLEEARRQFNVDRRLAESGDTSALERLPQSATEFLKASQIFNASSAEFTSDFNLVKKVLDSAAAFADQEASIADKQLSQLEQSVNELVDINSGVKSVEDAIRELIQATLQGPGNPDISGQAIRDFFGGAGNKSIEEIINEAVRNGISGDQIADALGIGNDVINDATGGKSVSDREIREFVNANLDNPMAIYNAALANGISSTRLSDATGIPLSEINQFVRDNNLAAFEKGTDFVPRTGIAMLHKGEAVVGSTVADEIKALRQEVNALRREQNQQTNALINTTIESQRMNADLISKSNDEIARSSAWREQRVGVR